MSNGDDTNKTEDAYFSKWVRFKSWANSKLGLLIIGAIISGILIPSFQFTQRFIEWKRQKQYETFRGGYENKKLLLKKLIEHSAYMAGAQEALQDFFIINNKKTNNSNHIYNRINDMQLNKFRVETEIQYLVSIVKIDGLEESFKRYANESQEYVLEAKGIIRNSNSAYLSKSKFNKLNRLMDSLDRNYLASKKIILDSIQETDDENKNFRLF